MTEFAPRPAQEIKELLALYGGAHLVVDELEQLVERLLRDPRTAENWAKLLREIVACAVYNQLDLGAAERLVTQC